MDQVFKRTDQDHSLYLERFSFEELLKTFDEKRLKFIGDWRQPCVVLRPSVAKALTLPTSSRRNTMSARPLPIRGARSTVMTAGVTTDELN
jgi:hypothetical protein